MNTPPPLIVRPVQPEEWRVWRDLRLAALADAPDAFSTQLAEVQGQTDAFWQTALAQPATPEWRCLIALYHGVPSAMAVASRHRQDPSKAYLFAMWVAPAARGRGVGRAVVEAALAWAISENYAAMRLLVTVGSKTARNLYARLGFVSTGVFGALRPGSPLQTEEMERPLR